MSLKRFILFLTAAATIFMLQSGVLAENVVLIKWLNKSISLSYRQIGKTVYLPLGRLSKLYGGGYSYSAGQKTMLATIKNHKVQVQSGNIIVYVDKNIYSLNNKPFYKDGEMWVPANMLKILGRVYIKFTTVKEAKIEVKPEQGKKSVPKAQEGKKEEILGKIKDIRVSTHSDFTRVVFEFDKMPEFSSQFDKTLNALRVVLKGVYVEKKVMKDVNDGFIKVVKVSQEESNTNIMVYLSSALPFRVFSLSTPPRLVVDVNHKRSPVESKGKETITKVVEQKKYKPSKRPLILIDPGHGGRDPGAIGLSGLKEKDVTLQVGLLLRKYLLSMGYRVAMTRTKDVFVSLKGRTKIAQKLHADLFISLHCNAAFSRKAAGAEVYYMSLPSSRSALETAIRENKSLGVSSKETERRTNMLSIILADMKRNIKLNTSARLAEILQKQIKDVKWVYSRKVAQAPFVVLEGFDAIPAVLVEMAFISNPREEKLLANTAFQKRMAKNIAIGINKFFSVYRGRR